MTSKEYSESDIRVLNDREHVRLRLPVYAGSTHMSEYTVPLFIDSFKIKSVAFIPAVYKCIGEIIDNSLDEFVKSPRKQHVLSIETNSTLNRYTISDTGRGVPIGKHKIGKFTPEVVFGSLRSGRNFTDNKEAGVLGMNGMGSSVTNFCSLDFQIKIQREGKTYQQKFSNGALNVTNPHIRRGTTKTGTEVSFILDPEIFQTTTLPDELMHNRAIEIALTNPGLTVNFNGKKYKFKKGFDDYIKTFSNNVFKFHQEDMEFFVIFDFHDELEESIFTWVNSSFLFDGGLCNTQFINAFITRTVEHLQPLAKKKKAEVSRNDIRQGLTVFGNLKLSDPQYDAQSKTRLTGPNLRSEMQGMIDGQWKLFAKQNKDWLEAVLERAMARHHIKANQKAIKEYSKTLKKKVPGLVDATHKNRQLCQILITEGLSAASMITEARNPKTTASFPLTGKVNNVYGTTVAQVLKMGKLTNLLASIGLIPGKKALRSQLYFGKIVIATDADFDGSDIFTLLINLFYQFWPELFDKQYEPIIYRLIAPNVCLVKGNQRIHFSSREIYEKNKSKYRGWNVRYYKGLGSMQRADWDMILSGKTDTFIPIVDDGKMLETLKLLFSPDADSRKAWLQEN
jgi:DNA gyrase/topoisomerase IV subunit B